MHFIAIFNQRNERCGIGFERLVDASDFLFWGYEDNDLLPDGIYDVMTAMVTPYEHIDRIVGNVDSETIRRFAINYVNRISQPTSTTDR